MDLDIGSKETETLIKLLYEFRDGPYCLSTLVQELRQKGYCKNQSSAYHYANRILAIRKVFNTMNAENLRRVRPTPADTPEQAHKHEPDKSQIQLRREREERERLGLPILHEIDRVIESPLLSITQKRQFCALRLKELSNYIEARLTYQEL